MANIRKMQSKNPPTVTSTSISTIIAPNGPGSLIVVWIGVSNVLAYTLTPVDDAGTGQVWTAFTGSPVSASASRGFAFWTITNTSKAFTVTATQVGGGAGSVFMNMLLDEFTGVDVTSPHIASAMSTDPTGAVGTITSSSVTPTVNRALIWSACNDNISAVGTGFTVGANDGASDWSEWRVLGDATSGVSTTATYTSTGGAYTMAVAAFAPAPHPTFRPRTRPAPFKPGLAR